MATTASSTTTTTTSTSSASAPPITLPPTGAARVKSVLSGDSVVLLGKPKAPNLPPPEVIFTMESVNAPRLAGKTLPQDEPGAFEAREWLRRLVVGKVVRFVARKHANDRVYGYLLSNEAQNPTNLAIECVSLGFATPKAVKFPNPKATTDVTTEKDEADDYESQLLKAYQTALEHKCGIHADAPMVRSIKNAGDDFVVLALVEACQKLATRKRVKCVIEYIFDGSRFRCHVVDDQLVNFQYANFTLLLAGVTCPRSGNPKASPPVAAEPLSQEARQFVTTRLLQRELYITLVGTDKHGMNAVGTVHHPVGNIAIELLKAGLARMTDWSLRLLPAPEVPALRVAENSAKRTLQGVWHAYAPPVLTSASQVRGTVVEVISGDTILILPEGQATESAVVKISLASVRAPRVGNERAARSDEPYALECKDRLRVLTIGKPVQIEIHYERDIPIRPGETEKRPFGTLSVVGKHDDVADVLIQEGLAVTQRHRDEDEKSPRYDELLVAEANAKAAKKGIHGAPGKNDSKKGKINDLTDQHKAKSYSGSLIRAGSIKAVVEYVFNGALFKLYVPSENCTIRFSPNFIRCPQPSPSPGSRQPGKPAEPFGDEAKFHARLNVLQRQVEIVCSGVTNSGIILGNMFTGYGSQRRDYTIELIGAGFATVDQRKIDYNEAPKSLVDAQNVAKGNKVGLWSIVPDTPVETAVKSDADKVLTASVVKGRLSDIRSGSHFFYQVIGDEALPIMEDSMKQFTQNHGTAGAPCDVKIGKIVAAVFDDGSGKLWYRAKIVERKGKGKVTVLFVDYGNVAVVPVSSHLRPLDTALGTDRIPPVAKEAVLALTVPRPLHTDEGIQAARMLQSFWGKDLTINTFAPDENGKMAVSIVSEDTMVNAELIEGGLARVANQSCTDILSARLSDSNTLLQLASDLELAEGQARKNRNGMWRYGDVGDEDPDEL